MKFAKGGKVANAKSYTKAYSAGGFIDEFAAGMTKGYGEGSKKKAADPNLTTVEAPTPWEKLKGKFSSLGSSDTPEKSDG